jgi:PKD repeat protein
MIRPRRTQSSRMPARPRSNERGPTESGSQPTRRGRRAMRQLVALAALVVPALVAVGVVFAASPSGDFTISDTVPEVGQGVTFTATNLADTDGGTPTVSWDFGANSSPSNGSSNQHTVTYSSAGTKTVTMTIADPEGTDPATPVTKTIRVNAKPSVSVSCSPANPAPNDPITCNASASDPEGSVSYAWDKDGNGFNDGSDPSEQFSFPAGTYTIRVQVTDSDGATANSQASVTVANAAPTATITEPPTPQGEPNGNVPYVGQEIQFTGTGSDPNGDNLSYTWSFPGEGSAGGQTVTHAFRSPGAKTVTLTVSDGTATGTDTTQVTINALPVARAGVINSAREAGQRNDVPLVGQQFALTGGPVPAFPPAAASPGSTDADGTITTYKWDLDNNGQYNDATGQSVPFGPFPTAGPRTVGLEVTDSNGARATTPLTVNVNSEPTAQFTVEPVTPIIREPVTFTSHSFDAQDNAGQLTYKWDLDNDNVYGEAGTATQPEERTQSVSRSFATAGTYPVKLRVTDTGGITREATPRNIVVQNTIPKGGFTWSPNSPLPNETVTFSGSPSVASAGKSIQKWEWDLDYDPTKDQFDVNASGVSVSHSFPSAGTKTVALKVTETDGGYGIVFDRVTVNAPPQASFSVSPASVFTGDPVTLSSTAGDPDGPLAKQEWDLDNDGQYDDAGGGVVFATFARAGSFPLKLRVTDSKGATAVAVRQVDVANRPVAPPSVLPGVLIEFKGRLAGKFTELTRLLVRSPKGSKVVVRCATPRASAAKLGCPKRLASKSKGRKKLRFKKLERKFAPGARLIVTVTKKGFIGKYTTVRMRRGKPPLRRDLCLWPGARKGKACPS